jgi:hypothetical protein
MVGGLCTFASCGGARSQSAAVAIRLSPTSVSIPVDAKQQFTAIVADSPSTAVIWAVVEGRSGGEVTDAGLYTASSIAGHYRVQATSAADPTNGAVATVTVTSDLSKDGGLDGGSDGGIDGGSDGGIDGGSDGGLDGGIDAGSDAGAVSYADGGAAAAWANWPLPAEPPAGYITGTGTAFGTVTDMVTGLVWQQSSATSPLIWAAAKTYCASLGLGGVSTGGWRLPSVIELLSLVDDTRSWPAINPVAFPSTPSTSFWSSSPSAVGVDSAWIVSFIDGGDGFEPTSNSDSVRCVH